MERAATRTRRIPHRVAVRAIQGALRRHAPFSRGPIEFSKHCFYRAPARALDDTILLYEHEYFTAVFDRRDFLSVDGERSFLPKMFFERRCFRR